MQSGEGIDMAEQFTPEKYLLRYAFPCAINKLVAKKITQAEYDRMKEAFESGAGMPREFLERVYTDAIPELRQMAGDYWRVEVMRAYFWNRHNFTVPAEYPQEFRELCEIRSGTLEQSRDDGKFVVLLETGHRRLITAVYPAPQLGDTVMVHYGYAVEKI
jgi:hypothetical protein